jgi:hypothetical protein
MGMYTCQQNTISRGDGQLSAAPTSSCYQYVIQALCLRPCERRGSANLCQKTITQMCRNLPCPSRCVITHTSSLNENWKFRLTVGKSGFVNRDTLCHWCLEQYFLVYTRITNRIYRLEPKQITRQSHDMVPPHPCLRTMPFPPLRVIYSQHVSRNRQSVLHPVSRGHTV